MHKDTRSRNKYFDASNIANYLKGYAEEVFKALGTVNKDALKEASDDLWATVALRGRVFVGGNGGSAAIADHFMCDHEKGCAPHNNNIYSLVGSVALHTAIGNDLGYDQTLRYQLQLKDLCPTDVVVLISSSGNSPNIVEAAKFTNEVGASLIGMTGFDGGKLKELSDISLHVDSHNYGVIEDCHQSLMHILAQFHHLRDNV